MENAIFMAIDIGASSGRHVLAEVVNNDIKIDVIYRFENHPVERSGAFVWDIDALVLHVIEGLKRAFERGKCPQAIGIDTFGVDYVLLDKNNRVLGDVFAYRDHRNFSARKAFSSQLNESIQYQMTGIQPLVFNTIYQLFADRQTGKLAQADKIMMLPCYLGYALTGVFQNEYTISSTSGLLHAKTGMWDPTLCGLLGIDKSQFGRMVFPGDIIGPLTPTIAKQVGYNTTVMAVSSHDTASAVIGSLADDETAYLSSGTWSLIGVLEEKPILTEEARLHGFTNEGNDGRKIRFLKNIMGLWMVQETRREAGDRQSYQEIVKLAEAAEDYPGIVNVTDEAFLSPKSMRETILAKLEENGYPKPKTEGELYYSLFHSLALAYRDAVNEIEEITKRSIQKINIVGGGSQNRLLNRLTEKYCRRLVIAGPVEATALGNILVQMRSSGLITDISETKEYVKKMIESEKSHKITT